MKSFKLILAAAFAVVGLSATAQVNFDDPKYAVWGETADERKQNMLDNQFMKEAVDNRNYNLAAKYLQSLLEKCPKASQNIYTNGIQEQDQPCGDCGGEGHVHRLAAVAL